MGRRGKGWKKGHVGEGGGRKAESWPDSKPVERHALGKEKQTKKGMDSEAGKSSLRFEPGADRPTGRPLYIDLYRYIDVYTQQARPCRACCILCAEYFRPRRVHGLSFLHVDVTGYTTFLLWINAFLLLDCECFFFFFFLSSLNSKDVWNLIRIGFGFDWTASNVCEIVSFLGYDIFKYHNGRIEEWSHARETNTRIKFDKTM